MTDLASHYHNYFKVLRDTLGIPDDIVIHVDYHDFTHDGDPFAAGCAHKVSDKEYEITLTDDFEGDFEQIETIAHEFKHIQQMLSGDLDVAPDGYVWKGKNIGFPDDYESTPHEIDARIFEPQGLEIAHELGLIQL